MNEDIIKVDNCTISNEYVTIKNLSFNIKRGSFTVIKTGGYHSDSYEVKSLFEMLTLYTLPISGNFTINDVDILKSNKKRINMLKSKIGSLSYESPFLEDKTGIENVEFYLKCCGMSNKEAKYKTEKAISYIRSALEKISESYKYLNIERKMYDNDGGQQQKVNVTRSISNEPIILVCNNFTINLDSDNGSRIIKLLEIINKELGITIIYINSDKFFFKENKMVDKNIISLLDTKQ